MAPWFNIVFGLVMLGGGLSRKMTLIGTGSTEALAVAGAAIVGVGVYQLLRARRLKP